MLTELQFLLAASVITRRNHSDGLSSDRMAAVQDGLWLILNLHQVGH